MQNTLLNITKTVLLGAIAVTLLFIYNSPKGSPELGYDPGQIRYSTMTNTTASVATTSASVVSANGSRLYLSIVNDGSNVVYLTAGGTAVAGQGIRLNANGGTYFMDAAQNGTYTGQWSAITSSGTSSLTILEK